MESTRRHLEAQQDRSSGRAEAYRELNKNINASAGELREFLAQLKGRSPEEVMGVVAQSGLIKSTLLATCGCVALLVVCTIVPYALRDASADTKQMNASSAAKETAAGEAGADAEPDAAKTPADGQVATPAGEPDLERAAEAMGIGGAAEADPNKNPLDSKLDKLLDGIE